MDISFSDEDKLHTGVEVEGAVRETMQSLVKWTSINSIIGFVSLGLSLISGFVTYNRASFFNDTENMILMAISLISFALNLIINISLFNFSRQLKLALANDDQQAFEHAAGHIKNYFRMFMIMIIIVVVFAVVTGVMNGMK